MYTRAFTHGNGQATQAKAMCFSFLLKWVQNPIVKRHRSTLLLLGVAGKLDIIRTQ